MQEIRIALEVEINIVHFALCVMIDILKRPEVRTMPLCLVKVLLMLLVTLVLIVVHYIYIGD